MFLIEFLEKLNGCPLEIFAYDKYNILSFLASIFSTELHVDNI